MSAQRQKPIDFAAEGLCLALSVNRNCGIWDNSNSATEIMCGSRARLEEQGTQANSFNAVSNPGANKVDILDSRPLQYGVYPYV